MSVISDDVYEHYIEDTQVFPGGEWEIVHNFPEGCIFSRREFSGTLTFGNLRYNGVSDDYDFIMGFGEQYCQRLEYEIYCNNELYWRGYINHTLGYEVDEDNCTIKTTPLLLDEYDCFVLNGDIKLYPSQYDGITENDINVYTPNATACVDTEDDTLTDCKELQDMIDTFIKSSNFMDCNFTGNVVSSFFWLDDYYDGTTPTENYVTGAANVWEHIYLASIDKARNDLGSADAGNTWPEVTFNQLMKMLRDFFNVYWYIDDNGDFRLEHLHYFEADFADRDHTDMPDTIDLTAINNEFTDKPVTTYKNKWKHLESDMPYQEVLEMTDAENSDFIGVPIEYDIDCTYNYPKKNIKTYDNDLFMTDIQMLIDDPDSVTSEGFVVLCVKYMDIHTDTNLITGWTNGVANPWDTFTPSGPQPHWIQRAINLGSPPIDLGFSNDISGGAGVSVGDKFTLCYYVPAAGFAGTPTISLYDGTVSGSADIVGGATNLVTGAWTLITWTVTANKAAAYIQVRGNSASGDSFGNGAGAEAKFYLDTYDEKYYVEWEVGDLSGVNRNNGHFSTANLMENYWRHGRVLEEGEMNNADEVFESIWPHKVQETIIIPKCCTQIHWNQYYISGLGTGRFYKAAEKKYTHEVELYQE